MWPFKTIIEKVEDTQRISELQHELESTKALLRVAEKELEAKNETIRAYLNSAKDNTFVIDWKAMNAFSVERIAREGSVYTIIGYILQNDYEDDKKQSLVKEWTLYCSEEQHEKLASEFQAYIKDKK